MQGRFQGWSFARSGSCVSCRLFVDRNTRTCRKRVCAPFMVPCERRVPA